MYTIHQAAARSGVSVPLLRAWERRYGVVEPARTASGYRLYDEPAIRTLRAMRRLVEEGWAPSTAAEHLLRGGTDMVAAVLGDIEGADASPAPAGDDRAALIGRFVDAARRLDEPAIESVLDEMFARGSFERVTADLLMPSLVALGAGWAGGAVDVASEHTASAAVMRRLGAAFLAAARLERSGQAASRVIVGLPPGGRHELGALAFATTARRSGLGAHYLGADLPVADWVAAAGHADADGAVIGVVVEADVEPAQRVSRALREARPGIVVAFGGAAAGRVRIAESDDDRQRRRAGRPPEIVLPGDPAAAVERLVAALGGGGARA